MNKLKPQFDKAWKLIEPAQEIFLTTHESTDGDDLGSLLALALVLRRLGKQVSASIVGGVPGSLRFLPDSQLVSSEFEDKRYDLLIVFGCNKLSRTGLAVLQQFTEPLINFDHHPDNTGFGTVNIVDPQAAAVTELVYEFLKAKEISLDKEIATCLLTGLFTDTGGFKHANTSVSALKLAAVLLKKGARIDKIAAATMGRKSPSAVRAWAKGLENTRFDPQQKLVFSVLTAEDLAEVQASDEDLDGFVELLNNIPQAKFALLLRQDGEAVKGSLRSEPTKAVDVSQIARAFGGGGHKLAAGFKVKGKLVRQGSAWKIA